MRDRVYGLNERSDAINQLRRRLWHWTPTGQTTHSLNDYAVTLGENIHIDMPARLHALDLDDQRAAAKTVQHLERLVSRRKKHRKLTT